MNRRRTDRDLRQDPDMRAPGGILFWTIIMLAFYSGVWMLINS